jgi:hypothetical protein
MPGEVRWGFGYDMVSHPLVLLKDTLIFGGAKFSVEMKSSKSISSKGSHTVRSTVTLTSIASVWLSMSITAEHGT